MIARETSGPAPHAIAAAGIVHDLGNLIQIAASAINIVARTPGMPASHSGPILARAQSSLDQAGAIVRQSIGLARDHAVLFADTDVASCLADVAALAGTLEDELAVEVDVAHGLPRLCCDPLGLRSAVLNLVFNARDAIAGSGVIVIVARPAAIGVEIRVVDNGIGMSPATILRAFDPFFTTKPDGLGGVGLPMVDRFVRDWGGEIAIDSEPGVGTTVTLRLPRTRSREE